MNEQYDIQTIARAIRVSRKNSEKFNNATSLVKMASHCPHVWEVVDGSSVSCSFFTDITKEAESLTPESDLYCYHIAVFNYGTDKYLDQWNNEIDKAAKDFGSVVPVKIKHETIIMPAHLCKLVICAVGSASIFEKGSPFSFSTIDEASIEAVIINPLGGKEKYSNCAATRVSIEVDDPCEIYIRPEATGEIAADVVFDKLKELKEGFK